MAHPRVVALSAVLFGTLVSTPPLRAEEGGDATGKAETFSVLRITEGLAVSYQSVPDPECSAEKKRLLKEGKETVESWESEAAAHKKKVRDVTGNPFPKLKPETREVSVAKAHLPAEEAKALVSSLQVEAKQQHAVLKILEEETSQVQTGRDAYMPSVKAKVRFVAVPHHKARQVMEKSYAGYVKICANNLKSSSTASQTSMAGIAPMAQPQAPKFEVLKSGLSKAEAEEMRARLDKPRP